MTRSRRRKRYESTVLGLKAPAVRNPPDIVATAALYVCPRSCDSRRRPLVPAAAYHRLLGRRVSIRVDTAIAGAAVASAASAMSMPMESLNRRVIPHMVWNQTRGECPTTSRTSQHRIGCSERGRLRDGLHSPPSGRQLAPQRREACRRCALAWPALRRGGRAAAVLIPDPCGVAAFAGTELRSTTSGKIRIGVLAMLASIAMTVVCHVWVRRLPLGQDREIRSPATSSSPQIRGWGRGRARGSRQSADRHAGLPPRARRWPVDVRPSPLWSPLRPRPVRTKGEDLALRARLRGRDSNPDYLIQSQASYH